MQRYCSGNGGGYHPRYNSICHIALVRWELLLRRQRQTTSVLCQDNFMHMTTQIRKPSMLSNGASRFDSVVRATGEEVKLQSLIVSNDEDEPKPTRRSYSDSYSDPNRKGDCNLCL